MTTPKNTKMQVAKRDLFENLESPQTPCPEVHPFPMVVPKPTKIPETIKPTLEATISDWIVPKKNDTNSGPTASPKINHKTQEKWSLDSFENNFPSSPDIPAILPFANINMMDDMPIRTPPIKDK